MHAYHVHAHVPNKANNEAIVFGLDEQDVQTVKRSRKFSQADPRACEVEFELKYSYFEGLHRALESLSDEIIRKLNPAKDALAFEPSQDDFRVAQPPCEDIELDREVQMKALYGILHPSPDLPIMLIAGPFGTGKTRLLARAAYEILKRKRTCVLICAHHQTSADTFVEYFSRMKQSKMGWEIGVLRIVPNKSYFIGREGKYGITLKSKREVSPYDLDQHRLVVTTLGGKPRCRRGFFTHILIDEGAQTREPEIVGPLGLAAKYTRIVIAGDHCQVKKLCLHM